MKRLKTLFISALACTAIFTAFASNKLYMVVDLSAGPNATTYPISYLDDVPKGGWADEYKTTKLVLRRIEPGSCVVTVDKPYYIGVFEITQKQYYLITGSSPSKFSGNDKRPVERVSFDMIRGTNLGAQYPNSTAVDAGSFMSMLRTRTGMNFDLPTESQWEFACRAGTTTTYSYGDSVNGSYMWYNGNAGSRTHDVGTRIENPWGLYDMHGNVWEWCLDWTDDSMSGRVVRGGEWNNGAELCSSSCRGGERTWRTPWTFGIRLVMTINSIGGCITFDSNGGIDELTPQVIGVGASVINLPVITRKGYIFLGWYTEKEGGEIICSGRELNGDITAYAHWAKESQIKNVVDEKCGIVCVQYNSVFALNDITNAFACVTNAAAWTNTPATKRCQTIAFCAGAKGSPYEVSTFPGFADTTSQCSYFAVTAKGKIIIPEAGKWAFDCGHDDGFSATISGNGVSFTFEYANTTDYRHTTAYFYFPVAGEYDVSLLFYECTGGSTFDFSVAKGEYSEFDSSIFKLVGDPASGVEVVVYPEELTTDMISLSAAEFMYSGSEIKPDVSVIDGTEVDAENYEVEYSNNVNVGKAQVIVSGKGNYTGSVSVEFDIVSDNVSVRYDTNGGDTMDDGQVLSGVAIGELPIPTRTGYTFEGWYSDAGLTELSKVDDTFIIPASGATLFAKWAANEYVVKYDANGGKGTMEDLGFAYDEEKGLDANGLTKDGYSFVGWATTAEGKVEYANGAVVSNLTAEVDGEFTLFAKWAANEYVVKYDANGGKGTMEDLGFAYDEEKGLDANGFTKDGYSFVGWATTSEGKVEYANGAVVSNLTAEVDGEFTLFAKWVANEYVVKYDANGGKGTMEDLGFAYDEEKGLDANGFTKEGYSFVGWATTANGKVEYANGAVVSNLTSEVDGEFTLFAKWAANEYVVKYDANGGKGTMDDLGFAYDEEKGLDANGFTKEGYSFVGWATTANGKVEYANGAVVSNLTAEVDGEFTLFAKWAANEYVVKYDANGGKGTMEDLGFAYDEEKGLDANGFTKEGYSFVGWATTADGKVEYANGAVVSNLTAEVDGEFTLFAKWAANEYVVKYDANGGKGTMEDQGFVYDVEQSLSANQFTRDGYLFVGWTTNVECAVVYADCDKIENVSTKDDFTLYAVWEVISYTVSFDANGGEGSMADQNAAYDDEWKLPLCTFSRNRYRFVGWATEANGDVVYGDGGMVANISADDGSTVMLYAVWEVENMIIGGDSSKPDVMQSAQEYDGCVYDGEKMVGTIVVKAAKGKADRKSGKVTSKLTITIQMAGEKVSLKGGMDVNAGSVEIGTLSLKLGANGMSGTYGAYSIDGARNVFAAKDATSKTTAASVLAKWQGALAIAYPEVSGGKTNAWVGLSVTIAAKGKAKIAGTLADGSKVSVSGQMVVGSEWSCVPVNYAKKNVNLALVLWLKNDGSECEVSGIEGALVGKANGLDGECKFQAADLATLVGDDTYAAYFPNGVSVRQDGTKWIVANGAKAGKVALGKDGNVDEAKARENASALKLTYTAKTGAFKGSFKAYKQERGKPKAVSVSVAGVVIDGKGYGSASVKKVGSTAVRIE